MTKIPFHHRLLITLFGVGLLAACGGKTDEASGRAAAASAPKAAGAAITVVAQSAQRRDFDVNLQTIGTVIPVATVDIKAQTTSVVMSVHVREGQSVNRGSLLFTLDARPDEANVAKLRAQMAKGEADLADARRQLARAKDLVVKGFVSQGTSDTNQAQVDGLVASVASDKAALDAAQLFLSYTRVLAPASGRLGAISLAPGTSVQANVTTLVTLTQLDPINVAFSLPQRNLQGLLSGLKAGGAVVSAKLPEGKGALLGKLQFVDNAVDGTTGTVKVKARFDNQDNALWPGAFVNVALKAETIKDAVVIPTVAIIQTARGAIVYVNDGGKAASRPVVVVAQEGEETVVTGVKPGDRVVTEGRQNLRPDSAIVEREGVSDDKNKVKAPGAAASAPLQPASGASQAAP